MFGSTTIIRQLGWLAGFAPELYRLDKHCNAGSRLGLEALSLAGCEKVTEKGVTALLRGSAAAHSLTCLDVSRCAGLSGNALDIPPKVDAAF